MIFYLVDEGFNINPFLNRKYLAYFALLAGWICFCVWLYAHAIFPKWKHPEAPRGPVRIENLDIPLAFRWGSDIPLAGRGFDSLQSVFDRLDSTKEILVMRGYFFRDESASPDERIDLGRRRVENVRKLFQVDEKRILAEYLPQEVNADVRSNPFSAIGFEKFGEAEVLTFLGDTAQVCFPMGDSMALPAISLEALDQWSQEKPKREIMAIHLIGTADGSGIAEPADRAVERANLIKNRWIRKGWDEKLFHLGSGQRNTPHTLQNRCVLIYFEQSNKQ